ncbi:Hypothetical protein A7982_07757 [Minicystis rosea]|nr:Hypothetical protein A7982_07757 [Minicystis rosea]
MRSRRRVPTQFAACMSTSARIFLGALVLTTAVGGCDPDASARSDDEPVSEADEALYGDYFVTNVVPREGTSYFVSPNYLLDTSEAWGPQTLLLAVDRTIVATILLQQAPAVQVEKKKLTKTLQQVLGMNLAQGFEVTASSSTVVDEGWYKRLEAYPSFQTITWDLYQGGPFGPAYVTSGTVYRPLGVYFRTVVLAKGSKKGEKSFPEPPALPPPPPPLPPLGGRERQPGSITAIGVPVLGAEAVGIH